MLTEPATARRGDIAAKPPGRTAKPSRVQTDTLLSAVSRYSLPRSLEAQGCGRAQAGGVSVPLRPPARLCTRCSVNKRREPERAGSEQPVHSHGPLGKRGPCAALTYGLREAEKSVFMFSLMLFIAASQLQLVSISLGHLLACSPLTQDKGLLMETDLLLMVLPAACLHEGCWC